MSEPHGDAYAALRARVTAVIECAEPAALERVAPATPEWTVREVLSHLVGVTDDVVNGRLDGIATDAWTGAQVDARVGAPAPALLEEWEKNSPQFETMMRAVPTEVAGQAIFDAMTHEHDIRNALGAPGARDSDAVVLAWEWAVDARTRGGARAIRFVTEAGDTVAGAGDPVATVRASRFEILRAATGRRSANEIAGYAWDPAPHPALLIAAPIFRLRATDLGE